MSFVRILTLRSAEEALLKELIFIRALLSQKQTNVTRIPAFFFKKKTCYYSKVYFKIQ